MGEQQEEEEYVVPGQGQKMEKSNLKQKFKLNANEIKEQA